MNGNVCLCPRVFESNTYRFAKEMDALLDRFLEPKVENSDNKPTVSGTQTSKAYFLEIKLPGVTEKNLEVHFDNDTLTIQSMPDKARDGSPKGRVISFSTGSKKNAGVMRYKVKPFRKIYKMPKDADSRGISALFCDGVLSLEISKKVNAS